MSEGTRRAAREYVKVERRRFWRREWDSNPRWSCPHTRSPGVRLRPLGHPSGSLGEGDTSGLGADEKAPPRSPGGALADERVGLSVSDRSNPAMSVDQRGRERKHSLNRRQEAGQLGGDEVLGDG